MFTYKIFDTVTKECEEILNTNEVKFNSTFFQHIDYIKEIAKYNKNDLKIVVIYSNNLVIAILPFEIKKYYFLKILQWIGTEYSDYCNPILSKDFQTFSKKDFLVTWSLILNEIKNDLDLVFLNNQLASINDQPNPFIQYFKTSNYSTVYNINLDKNYNDYKEKIKIKNKKHAYEIHRTMIKYEKLKKISKNLKIIIEDSKNNEIDFNKIIEEKKLQLYRKKNLKNKLDNNFKRVFENLIHMKKIKFYLISLVSEDKALSRCFGFIYDNTFYYYMPILLSNSFFNYKPGKILILQLIKWCIKNDIKKFDFGLGDEKYKKYFSNKEISLHRYFKAFSFKGSLAYYLLLIIFKLRSFSP